jgi:hypothetical protein
VQTYKAEREFLSARLGNTAWNSERYIAGRLRVGQLFTGCVNSLLSNVQLLEKFWCAGTAQSSQQRNEADGHGSKMFSHQLRERVDDCEQARWREELARMSSLKLYRRLKQLLVREDYLTVADSHPQLARSLWDRRCTVDMARLRCGVADIALVRGRRCGVARQQHYCRWCDRESERNGGLLWCRAVEDEEHVLLQCGAYDALRRQLDEDIADITGEERMVGSRLVRTRGIGLLDTLQSHCRDARRAQQDAEWVLTFILAGCILREGERPTARHDALRGVVLQRCKQYCGDVMRARKAWWNAVEGESASETDDDGDDDGGGDGAVAVTSVSGSRVARRQQR